MPYKNPSELPEAVRNALPDKAARMFMHVVNSQEERGVSTERAFASAWSQVKEHYTKDPKTGKWHAIEKVLKFDTERQYVFGWASVAIAKDGSQIEDLQGDLIDVEDLEEAAYQYALQHRGTGVMHQGEPVGQMIESLMITPAKLEAMGLPPDALPQALWVGFHITDPDVFAKVKSGELPMFSIQGDAVREEV